MIIDNKKITSILNSIYSGTRNMGEGQLVLPNKELILEKLNNRGAINFFYLKPNMIKPGDDENMPEINVVLESFFAYPFGDKIWITDKLLKLFTEHDLKLPKETCNKIINEQYNFYMNKKILSETEEKTWDGFMDYINRFFSENLPDKNI